MKKPIVYFQKSKTLFIIFISILIFISGCREIIVDHLPDAENSIFTSKGQLFITGGKNIYKIKKELSGEYKAYPIYKGETIFMGMAEYNNYLYVIALKSNNSSTLKEIDPNQMLYINDLYTITEYFSNLFIEWVLLRTDLRFDDPDNTSPLDFQEIHTFKNVLMPNGMVADKSGRLYITDETLIGFGKIIRLTISENDPPVVQQDTWLSSPWWDPHRICAPNGIAINGYTIYFTDFNIYSHKTAAVKKVAINPDGTPGRIVTLFERTSFFDDLCISKISGKYGVLVTDFLLGSILFIEDLDHKKSQPDYESLRGTFEFPSSLKCGQGDLSNYLIVTEKGILFELNSHYGNKVSKIAVPEMQ